MKSDLRNNFGRCWKVLILSKLKKVSVGHAAGGFTVEKCAGLRGMEELGLNTGLYKRLLKAMLSRRLGTNWESNMESKTRF